MKQLLFLLITLISFTAFSQSGEFAESCDGGSNGALIEFLNSITGVEKDIALKLLKDNGYTIISSEKGANDIEIIAKKCKLKKEDGTEFFGRVIIVYGDKSVSYYTVNWWVLKQAKMLYVGDKIDRSLDDNSTWVYYREKPYTYTFWRESTGDFLRNYPPNVTYYVLQVAKY